MMERTKAAPSGHVDFACPEEDVVVIRVVGRGSFQNSSALKAVPRLAQEMCPAASQGRRYIVDLQDCVTMDSTFFGVLASIGLSQTRNNLGKMVLVNANPHITKILETLGLTQFMTLRESANHEAPSEGMKFEQAPVGELDKVGRIVMMLEAHKQLVEVYDQNRARFKNVMECLEASLESEQKKHSPPEDQAAES